MQPARLDVCIYVLLKITDTDYSVIFASFRASASVMSPLFPKLLRENYVKKKKKKKRKKDEIIKLKVNNNSYEHDETKRNMRKQGEKYKEKKKKKNC